MATIVLTIPDDQLPRVVDAMCGLYAYDPAVNGTRGAFAKACVVEWTKRQVLRWEEQQRQVAMQAAVPPVVPVDVT